MKKWTAALLCLLLLSGCGRSGKPLFDPVYFYYPRTEYDYGYADSVITWEAMDGTGHMDDLEYLMGEFFSGPIDEGLVNPFPAGTTLLSARVEGDAFLLEVSVEALALAEHQFTLGCSCLSMTCFELTSVQTVTVSCGEKSLTIRRNSMLLVDDYVPDS
ncbi:MAG: hypothetical protein ACI3XG_00415 [Faecousia sp.]